jgi:cob(I)alamin adenosyltransferase
LTIACHDSESNLRNKSRHLLTNSETFNEVRYNDSDGLANAISGVAIQVMAKNCTGLVQVFTGDGKGKTTAALGAILRAVGHGLCIFVVFFIKGSYAYGEFSTLDKLPNVRLAVFGLRQFIDKNSEINPEEKRQAGAALAAAREAITSGRYDLVVLDEINVALDFHLIATEDVIDIIKNKPSHVELILTGRNADARLIEMADLVTEMVNIKHPFDKGVKARQGIEY